MQYPNYLRQLILQYCSRQSAVAAKFILQNCVVVVVISKMLKEEEGEGSLRRVKSKAVEILHPCTTKKKDCARVGIRYSPTATSCEHQHNLLVYFASLSFNFGLFKQTLQFLQQYNVKNVQPVSGARIQTRSLLDVSLLP